MYVESLPNRSFVLLERVFSAAEVLGGGGGGGGGGTDGGCGWGGCRRGGYLSHPS